MLFGTIIDISKDGNVLLNKKFIHLVPEFQDVYNDKNLGGTMIKWIVCVYDKMSPFRHLPIEVRKEDMTEKFFGTKEHSRCHHPKVQKAIDLYNYVQYDPLQDQYDALVQKNKEKIKIFNLIEVTDKNLMEMNNIEEKMLKSGEKLRKLKDDLKLQDEENQMMGSDAELSFIEERLIKYKQEKNENLV